MRVNRAHGGRVDLVDDRGAPVECVADLLGWLSAAGRSPNTVKAYAYDLLHSSSPGPSPCSPHGPS